MLPRLALAALLILGATAPSAGASTFIKLPIAGPEIGIEPSRAGSGELVLRFTAKASKRYRTLTRRPAAVTCTDVEPPVTGGFPRIEGSHGSDLRVPERRGTLRLRGSGASDDLCVVTTKRGRSENCIETDAGRDADTCARVIVATSDEARTHLDEVGRSWDLLAIAAGAALTDDDSLLSYDEYRAEIPARLRDRFVALADAEGTPPADTVGYWTDGNALAVVTLTAAGTRRYVRLERSGAMATNAYGLFTFGVPGII